MIKKAAIACVVIVGMAGTIAFGDTVRGIDINFSEITGTSNTDVGYNYKVSSTEITFAQFFPSGVGSGDENTWVSTVGSNAPAVNVTFVEAARYCNWLTSGSDTTGAYTIGAGLVVGIDRSYRNTQGMVYLLPTLEEFNNAAYFNLSDSTYYTYANTNNVQPSSSDTRYLDNTAPWVVGSGAMEQNGTYDMMGNVWEWLENNQAKGGAYTGTVQDIKYAGQHPVVPQTQPDPTLGLRIVAIPEPGTISLMSFSTIGLFLTRTIRRRKRLGQSLLPIPSEHRRCDVFCSDEDELVPQDVEPNPIGVVCTVVMNQCIKGWGEIRGRYAVADKAFWNRMVVLHERKVARRVEFRQAFRKKALDCFDAFLARIMK